MAINYANEIYDFQKGKTKSAMNKALDSKETDERQCYFLLKAAFQIAKMNVLFFI